MAHLITVKRFTQSGNVSTPQNAPVYGHVFVNIGNSQATVTPGPIASDQWTLNPGDVVDTRCFGSIDKSTYNVRFASTPSVQANQPCANVSEVEVTTYIKVE